MVVGVDGSRSSLRAARWGAARAHHHGVVLRLVSAFGWPEGQDDHRPTHGRTYRALLLDETTDRLAVAASEVTAELGDLEVVQHVGIGHPVPVLGQEARHAQLVVLGDRGLGGFSGLVLGSVALGMAARSACPVVVVRGPEPAAADGDAPLPVVVGVDGSPLSEAAVAFAFAFADERGAPLVALHTWWVDPVLGPVLDREVTSQHEHEVLAERLAGWADTYPDVRVERMVVHRQAVGALRELSERAQLVVVGSRGRGGFEGMLLGSVSQALLHHSACPVAVVRAD